MGSAQKFHRHNSTRSEDLLTGLAASILLHLVLLIGANNWLLTHAPDRRQDSQPIPIKFVEVPPEETKPPKETKLRAARNSSASGKAKPEQSVSATKLAPTAAQRTASSPKNSLAPELAKPVSPKAQSSAVLPDLSPQKPQLETRKPVATSVTPKPQSIPQKTAAVTTTPKLQPKTQNTLVERLRAQNPEPTIPPPQSKPQKTTTAPIPKLKPKPQETATDTTNSALKPSAAQEKNTLPPKSAAEQLTTRVTSKTQPPQPSPTSGAASKLGGPVTLSSRNLGSDDQATPSNPNRSDTGESIAARRDPDIGPYLAQLQQRVRQQWIPGLTQNSQRTVVYFVVSSSGQVSNLRIMQPSGSSVADKAALSAVERAAPFAPLPPGYSQDYINIQFTFSINVYGDLDLWVR